MNRTDLIYKVADKVNLPKSQVDRIINATFDEIKRELISGGKVQILGFGTFEVRTRAPRKGKNPRTGETIDLPEHKVTHFACGKPLKEAVNNADRRRKG